MAEKELIEKLKEEFSFLEKEVLGVVLFGSHANRQETSRSDIDICIIAPKKASQEILSKVWSNIDTYGKNYDVKIFEELPINLKIQVIKNHKIILTKDKFDLYEYFYFYRKLWKDQEHRQKLTKKELLEILS